MRQNKALRIGRAATGLTQYDVSHLSGISANRYWRIENGYVEATPEEQQAIARVLELDPQEAFPSSAVA